jgi:hypothetical protein
LFPDFPLASSLCSPRFAINELVPGDSGGRMLFFEAITIGGGMFSGSERDERKELSFRTI